MSYRSKALAVVACLTVGVLVSLAGLAQADEFGHCVKAESVLVGKKTVYHGAYQNSKCSKASATKTGKWEWSPGVTRPGFTFANSNAHVFFGWIPGPRQIEAYIGCAAESGHGAITGGTTVAGVTMRFTGCGVCTTPGLEPGELETTVLHGTLGGEELALYPEGSTFVVADCRGKVISLEGSAMAKVTLPKIELRFLANKGLSFLELGPEEEVIERVELGLGLEARMTTEEPLELHQ
jgi:hypothetical protein